MLRPASAEFIALCQAQTSLITQSLGADSTAVYLAENWADRALPELVPIAVYPHHTQWTEAAAENLSQPPFLLPENHPHGDRTGPMTPRQNITPVENIAAKKDALPEAQSPAAKGDQTAELPPPEQAVVPLVHDGLVMGVLVSWRANPPWQPVEQQQLEGFAQTLALACVLDQRGQWLQAQMQDEHHIFAQQSERFHELLHQLRNPLTALQTFGKLLLKRLSSEDKNRGLALNMLRESDRMKDLLRYFDVALEASDAALNAAQTEPQRLLPGEADGATTDRGAIASDVQPLSHVSGEVVVKACHLSDLLAPLLASVDTLAEAKHIHFWSDLRGDRDLVLADPNALQEVITNLLENALKYSPPGAEVWLQVIAAKSKENRAYQGILIGDTGPGIPTIDQSRIFERHYRGVQAQSTIEGTGLGLAIVQNLIDAMDGRIELFSPLTALPADLRSGLRSHPAFHRGQGTAFVVWLPIVSPRNVALPL